MQYETTLESEMDTLRSADVSALRRRVKALEKENLQLATELDLANRTLEITLDSLHHRTRLMFSERRLNA